MTWFSGSDWSHGRLRLPRRTHSEPFIPRLPEQILERPGILGFLLAGFGVGASVFIIQTMHRWPLWLIFPSMVLAVLAMAATAIGFAILVVLALQPLIERKEHLEWDDEPLATMGIPLSLQRKCESLGYWTIESLTAAIDRGTFPWTDLEYDERLQIDRAVQFWKSTSAANEQTD